MKHVLLFSILMVSAISYGGQEEMELEIAILQPDSVVADPALDSTCILHFNFPDANDESGIMIQYSIDGVSGIHSLIDNEEDLQLETTEGYHDFQFYYSTDFYEEYTSAVVEAGNHYYYTVVFTPAEVMIMTEKPVIYLYPTEEQEVHVNVEPAGEFTFTYPKYEDGWDVLASPNGKLTVNEQSYNYLFWEASEQLSMEQIDFNIGYTVAGSDVTEFLEETLSEAGLNSTEIADFITFWAPRMSVHDDVFMQFQFNEACNRFGELDITPRPDNLYRIYVIWQPLEQLRMAPTPQEIPKMNREGFTVLEWGGQELPASTMTRSL
ncbi:MAG: hypothetical protein NXI10_13100 [bacterium]|nr:hypothetical protein [bacterium]